MYIPDRPIKNKDEDILNRAAFSEKLAESILSWNRKDSLVISLSGEWGSGKSSVINLMKEYLSKKWNTPTVLEFNPWAFSGEGNLNAHFFNEIAKELEIRNESAQDKEIAQKLRLYTKILDLIPASISTDSTKNFLTILGALGISVSFLTNPHYKNLLLILSLVLIVISLSKTAVNKLAELYDETSKIKEMSLFSLKEELKCDLSLRSKKLLIIVDDIDRLNKMEIKQIVQLIKVNTDFPNTVYLLSFDKRVVEAHLTEDKILGKDFLKKIVEVDFDIPYVSQDKVRKVLLIELERIFKSLPEYSTKNFDQMHWSDVYNTGFKNFFVTIRDVKRFCSSLEFNISMLCREKSIEVNPVDFTAVEAIRVFCPEFYAFMKSNKSLFTNTGYFTNNTLRINEINTSLCIYKKYKQDLESLIHILFPQFSESIHPDYWQSTWNRELRICATDYFDAYFTLSSGGEDGISQFEIDSLLNTLNNPKKLQLILCDFVKNNKIRLILDRLQDYVESEEYLPIEYSQNLIQAMFNISDCISNKVEFMFDSGSNREITRITYQILKRNEDKHKNYEILKDTTINSKSLSAPVETISFEIHRTKEENLILLESDYEDLKLICLEKIRKFNHEGKLFENPNFDRIIYAWKEWDDSEECQNYIDIFIKPDEGLIKFISKFTNTIFSQEGMYLESERLTFKYNSLKALMNLEEIKFRLEALRSTENPKYLENKNLIDLFLNDFGKKE